MADETPVTNKEQAPEKKKFPLKVVIIILGILFMEGGSFVAFKMFFGGPKPAAATEAIADTKKDVKQQMAEVVLAKDFRVDNYVTGRVHTMITLNAVAKTKQENQAKLDAQVKEHANEILSTIREIVAQASPDQIKDPKLEVIKRQIKAGVDTIVGKDLVTNVLLPVWQLYTAD